MTPSGIEPATCRFVAQCLNHYATAAPVYNSIRKVFQNQKLLLHYLKEGGIRFLQNDGNKLPINAVSYSRKIVLINNAVTSNFSLLYSKKWGYLLQADSSSSGGALLSRYVSMYVVSVNSNTLTRTKNRQKRQD